MELLTLDQAGAELRISRTRLFIMAENGELPAVRVGASGKIMFRRADIEAALKLVPVEDVATLRQKTTARMAVARAIKDGTLVRQSCHCGKAGEAHHPDYSKPLEVEWLCKQHHRERHAQERLALTTKQ
jgi:excisionase family DNA binding protein